MTEHFPPSALQDAVFDRLCPMHLRLDETGKITHAGPTLAKLRPGGPLVGRRFFEVFTMRRPGGIADMADLHAQSGAKMHLAFAEPPGTELKAIALPLPPRGMIVDMSFGISILDAVRNYRLTSADFAPTDLTVEMLYLIEAKSAAMDASRKLNHRLQGARIAAEEQAFTDTLTGLKNRRALDHVLARHLASQTPFALMHIDLDHFKAVNDTMGHAAGDEVLLRVARVLVDAFPGDCTAARVGGDEFIAILPGCIDRGALADRGQSLIAALERPVPFKGQQARISASIGTVIHPGRSGRDAEALIEDADVALYASKRAGRGRQTFYDPALRRDPANLAPPAGRV